MIDHLALKFPVEGEFLHSSFEINLRINRLSGGGIQFLQANNLQAKFYKHEFVEPRWLELIVAAENAELTRIETGVYYSPFSGDKIHDTLYHLQLLDYQIFAAWRSHFLWVVKPADIERLTPARIPVLLFNWRNVEATGDNHYKNRHELMMECLAYLGKV